jgi:hypothetical protein
MNTVKPSDMITSTPADIKKARYLKAKMQIL